MLADRAAGVGREVLEHGFVGRGRVHDDRVLHRAVLLERGDGLRDGRALLADRDVDALHALAPLVEDRVDRDRGLAGLAVADDQLALTAADRRHGVDGLDAGLQRLVHRLAADDAGRLHLEAARPRWCRSGPCRRSAWPSAFDDPADERVADRDREDAAGALDRAALLDVAGLAEDHRTDRVLVEVQREAERAALELEHLVDRRCSGRPATRAMPSPTSSTRPTCAWSSDGVNVSTCLRSAAAISSALMVSSMPSRSAPSAVRGGDGRSRR